MSTQFCADSTNEWVATRFFGGSERGACFDFGADPSAVLELKKACEAGESFHAPDTGERHSGPAFWELLQGHGWTFGEFCGTVELGDGTASRFEGLR